MDPGGVGSVPVSPLTCCITLSETHPVGLVFYSVKLGGGCLDDFTDY